MTLCIPLLIYLLDDLTLPDPTSKDATQLHTFALQILLQLGQMPNLISTFKQIIVSDISNDDRQILESAFRQNIARQ